MSATAAPPTRPVPVPTEKVFEVATVSADASRANIRTAGALTRRTCAVVVSVLQAHLVAGRHYLCVDVGGSAVDESAVAALAEAHRSVDERGATLAFENAPRRLVDAIRDSKLSTRAFR